jgi:hypothetical protein
MDLKGGWSGMGWIDLAQWMAVVNMEMSLGIGANWRPFKKGPAL